MRQQILDFCNLDIIGIAETHLRGKAELIIPGYTWKGQNRKAIHVNARIGSGEVGFLLKDHILENVSVIIADDTYEGIY